MITRKQRMLNAYRGVASDYIPVAPEFWFYYPAKVLGITVAEFQHEVPHWQGMLASFNKYDCEGWGIAGADVAYPGLDSTSEFKRIDEGVYRETIRLHTARGDFERTHLYHDAQPFWIESHPVKTPENIDGYMRATLDADAAFDFTAAVAAHKTVGEDFLLEFDLGLSFFDYFEDAMGFEEAVILFMTEEDDVLRRYYDMYLEHKLALLRQAASETDYESYFIGCSSSCIALLGTTLWRKWDKPYEAAMTAEAHRLGRLVHNHNHGRCMEIIPDFVEIGFDCVCPFERHPGDVNGIDGLRKARELLQNKVTLNGNVSTVRALINGTAETVREEVREIKTAFAGSDRLIVGTGDQVGGETPEENIYSMIEETRRK